MADERNSIEKLVHLYTHTHKYFRSKRRSAFCSPLSHDCAGKSGRQHILSLYTRQKTALITILLGRAIASWNYVLKKARELSLRAFLRKSRPVFARGNQNHVSRPEMRLPNSVGQECPDPASRGSARAGRFRRVIRSRAAVFQTGR